MTLRPLYAFAQTYRFLTFRSLKIGNEGDLNTLMVAGIIFAWIAGVGRYWDHPSAYFWQYAGLGSVAYIFVLSSIIWALVLPIRPDNWKYKSVLTFVGLTSPLAWLYAIPVEKMTDIPTAIKANIWFLAIVAIWRVALYVQFLRKVGKLSGNAILIVTLLPLTGIIFALMTLNLEHAVFEIMAGLENERTGKETIHDNVYQFIIILGVLSAILAPILFLSYLALCFNHERNRTNPQSNR